MKLFFWLIPIVSRYNLERWVISLNLNKVIVHDIDIAIYDEYCIFPRMKIQEYIFPKSNSPRDKEYHHKIGKYRSSVDFTFFHSCITFVRIMSGFHRSHTF